MWLLLSNLEEGFGNISEARKVLEFGRSFQGPDDDEKVRLYLASIHLELRVGNNDVAKEILRRLHENPRWSWRGKGEIWLETIVMEPRSTRELKTVEALRTCTNHRFVMLAVANMFFSRGDIKKCHKWFNKTIENWPRFFDAWAYFYKFEKLWGTEKKAQDVIRRLNIPDPRPLYGAAWMEYRFKIENQYLTNEEMVYKVAKLLPLPGIRDAKNSIMTSKYHCYKS